MGYPSLSWDPQDLWWDYPSFYTCHQHISFLTFTAFVKFSFQSFVSSALTKFLSSSFSVMTFIKKMACGDFLWELSSLKGCCCITRMIANFLSFIILCIFSGLMAVICLAWFCLWHHDCYDIACLLSVFKDITNTFVTVFSILSF